MANGRRDSFETPLKRDLDLFLGVGGSGRSPLNPPTPRYEGAGVRVNLETKRKFIVVYREVVKYIIKYSLRWARGQGLGGNKRTPGPSVRLHIYYRSCNLARAGLPFTCIFTIDPATWPPSGALGAPWVPRFTCIFTIDPATWLPSGALGAPWAPRCARDLDLKVILGAFLCRRGCKVPTLQTIMC